MMTIMLGGQARVGKTTLAKWLSEFAYNNGYTPIILPFAAAIKDEAEKRGYSKDKNPEEYRAFCQTLGSSARSEDADYWVKRFRERVKELYAKEQKDLETDPETWHEKVIIVDDCRYMNEVAASRDIRALTIFISPGDRMLIDHGAEWRNHESEDMANRIDAGEKDYQGVFHYFIRNEGTLAEFKEKCSKKFDEWFSILSENLVENLCTCELCMSSREDREPDAKTVFNDIMELMMNPNEQENYGKAKRKKADNGDT